MNNLLIGHEQLTCLEADFYQITPLIEAIQEKKFHNLDGTFLYVQYFSAYIPVRFRSTKREVLETEQARIFIISA